MRKFWILWLLLLGSVTFFNKVTESAVLPFQNNTETTVQVVSLLSASQTSILEDIIKHTSYDVPAVSILIGGERCVAGWQRRNVKVDKDDRTCFTCLCDFSFVKYKLTGGDYLNLSAPKDFFIYSLHKIRI